MRFICSFRVLVSVRFQIYLYGDADRDTSNARATAVDRITRLVWLCGDLDVKICWEPNLEWPESKEIIGECVEKLGQDLGLPPLHQEYLKSWPTEKVYVTPALRNERAETPPPSVEEMRSLFTPEYASQKWPKLVRS